MWHKRSSVFWLTFLLDDGLVGQNVFLRSTCEHTVSVRTRVSHSSPEGDEVRGGESLAVIDVWFNVWNWSVVSLWTRHLLSLSYRDEEETERWLKSSEQILVDLLRFILVWTVTADLRSVSSCLKLSLNCDSWSQVCVLGSKAESELWQLISGLCPRV